MLTHITFVLGLEKPDILGSLSVASLGSYYSAGCRRHNTILAIESTRLLYVATSSPAVDSEYE